MGLAVAVPIAVAIAVAIAVLEGFDGFLLVQIPGAKAGAGKPRHNLKRGKVEPG